MSGHADERLVKRRKTRPQPLLQEINAWEDGDISSTTSSSSSENLLPIRHAQRLRRVITPAGEDESSTDSENIGVEEEEETSTSSESEDTKGDGPSEVESSDENEGVHVEGTKAQQLTGRPAPEPDLKLRLQAFLPQLQQANAELETLRASHDLRIDQISDDADHYIEMDLGLGVLAEEENESEEIKIPRAQWKGDETSTAEGIKVSVDRLQGDSSKTKRKIEELG
ncbi:hypothetical protein PV04_09589 [Phialophora macrospora]|uniref:Uncharacterized protein n=1 Tax=Phialophora macrospora TaxID=1851006 RepID=A0A0D2CHG0_9EURO|nr:hypothetical protein PV04_09589 [Phialophora macrospora]